MGEQMIYTISFPIYYDLLPAILCFLCAFAPFILSMFLCQTLHRVRLYLGFGAAAAIICVILTDAVSGWAAFRNFLVPFPTGIVIEMKTNRKVRWAGFPAPPPPPCSASTSCQPVEQLKPPRFLLLFQIKDNSIIRRSQCIFQIHFTTVCAPKEIRGADEIKKAPPRWIWIY